MKPLDNNAARIETTAERALLRRIEGGCQVPLGAIARLTDNQLTLYAAVCSLDGAIHVSAEGHSDAALSAADSLGIRLADQLLSQGAARIIQSVRAPSPVEAP
jgi:hydroxymethylbilane synthase